MQQRKPTRNQNRNSVNQIHHGLIVTCQLVSEEKVGELNHVEGHSEDRNAVFQHEPPSSRILNRKERRALGTPGNGRTNKKSKQVRIGRTAQT